MTKLFLCTSFVLAAVLALTDSASAQQARPTGGTRTTSTYSCAASPMGQCAFLLYTSDCKEGPLTNGHPTLVCKHAVVANFMLKPGESKTFQDLPPNTKQCQPRNGKLAFPDCMR